MFIPGAPRFYPVEQLRTLLQEGLPDQSFLEAILSSAALARMLAAVDVIAFRLTGRHLPGRLSPATQLALFSLSVPLLGLFVVWSYVIDGPQADARYRAAQVAQHERATAAAALAATATIDSAPRQGELFRDGDWEYRVDEVRRLGPQSPGPFREVAKGEYMVIGLTATNISKAPTRFSTSSFSL